VWKRKIFLSLSYRDAAWQNTSDRTAAGDQPVAKPFLFVKLKSMPCPLPECPHVPGAASTMCKVFHGWRRRGLNRLGIFNLVRSGVSGALVEFMK